MDQSMTVQMTAFYFNGDKIRVASDALILAWGRTSFLGKCIKRVARATSICTERFNATRDTRLVGPNERFPSTATYNLSESWIINARDTGRSRYA